MNLLTLVLFIPACFALNMAPGPNNILLMNNAQSYGFKYAICAGIGRLVAFVMMIILAATGLVSILYASETLFLIIKILGAIYLFWIAYQLYCANVETSDIKRIANHSIYQLAKQEFLLAIGNPKAILIFTAFLPQFIDPLLNPSHQFYVLGSVFLGLEFIAISLYACMGVYLNHYLNKPSIRRLFNKGCAAVIGSLGISLFIERQH